MSRIVSLIAEIPDETEDLDSGEQFRFSVRADGVEMETVPPILLAGVLALARTMIRADMEEENPMGNADFMDRMAPLEARLLLLDFVMHLPERDESGIVTTV